jgi:glutamine synthetase
MGDQLWMSRYIMYRVAEMFNIEASFDPKPIPGDWNGSGGHTNYSTNGTRAEGTGWAVIQEHCAKLEKRHGVHIAQYGEGNERRLTGGRPAACCSCLLLLLVCSWFAAVRWLAVVVGRLH